MSDPKSNDPLPTAIGDALKQIHEPPPTPRDEMWQNIQAHRRASKVVPGKFSLRRSMRPVLAAAAVLLIGFVAGRLWEESNTPEPAAQNHVEAPPTDRSAPAALSQAQLLHAANHFNRSGVLLAQFAETAGDEDPLDPELHKWARDLLANTRLLLDSPLAADPQYRKLLRDLEFTLAQIVQASIAEDEKEERQWVAGQVSDRSLVERLRLIVPALPGSRDI